MLALVAAYLLGSFPSAVLVSRAVAGMDVRTIGDGNMGARNTSHTLGWWPGLLVAVLDFGKGVVVIGLARQITQQPWIVLLAGALAVLGHDFPIFAHLRGGQGMATSLGVLTMILPAEAFGGLLIFGGVYLVTRNFDLSASLGLGSMVALTLLNRQPALWALYAAALFAGIGMKKWHDSQRDGFPINTHFG